MLCLTHGPLDRREPLEVGGDPAVLNVGLGYEPELVHRNPGDAGDLLGRVVLGHLLELLYLVQIDVEPGGELLECVELVDGRIPLPEGVVEYVHQEGQIGARPEEREYVRLGGGPVVPRVHDDELESPLLLAFQGVPHADRVVLGRVTAEYQVSGDELGIYEALGLGTEAHRACEPGYRGGVAPPGVVVYVVTSKHRCDLLYYVGLLVGQLGPSLYPERELLAHMVVAVVLLRIPAHLVQYLLHPLGYVPEGLVPSGGPPDRLVLLQNGPELVLSLDLH